MTLSWCEAEKFAFLWTFKGLIVIRQWCVTRMDACTVASCDFGRVYQMSDPETADEATVPAVLSAPSHNLTTHVGTFFQIRTTRQQTPRVRSDRVVSVEHVGVSMKADRIDQWRFFLLLQCQTCAKEARGLTPIPDDDRAAVQRIPSSDLPMLASSAVEGWCVTRMDACTVCYPVTRVYQMSDHSETADEANCSCGHHHTRLLTLELFSR